MSGWLGRRPATIVDLFAGTAGMGLATLLTPKFRDRGRIIYVAEIDSDYIDTINLNYKFFSTEIGHGEQLPARVEPRSVASRRTLTEIAQAARRNGGLTLLLAGPPCQGFSSANRVTRGSGNPLNRLALDTIEAVKAGNPKIAIIENVPGIRSTASSKRTSVTVAQHIETELKAAGYFVASGLLNAADYGVPQHRLRSFIVAINKKIAHEFDMENLFPEPLYGPGRRFPYRNVADAFGDLPSIGNGNPDVVLSYDRPAASSLQRELRRYARALFDHVTTRHSDYVLERFRRIPPGGNWQSIRRMLHNYADADRTHMNIYQRLDPQQPSRTIGNFRKAMTVHPWEDRGISLREAARLQSLPDWLRFFPDTPEMRNGLPRGLGARQQQVGNAVCFRLTQQLVTHLFRTA